MTVVNLHTNLGVITLEIDEKKTPETFKNFLEYVKEGFYNNTIFHRVIKGFMIQGGGLLENMDEKENAKDPITNEAKIGCANNAFTISMARTSDPHSATSQFFINLVDNSFLNFKSETMDGYGYCAFGKVIKGMDIVKQIGSVKTGSYMGYDDVPKDPVFIERAEIQQD